MFLKYLFLLLFSTTCFASDFHIISLDEIKIDYLQFFPGGREPIITNNGLPNRQLGQMLNLNVNSTLLKYGYFNTSVRSLTDSFLDTNLNGQFRSVGLQMELGIRIAPFLDVYGFHNSQHLLDTTDINIGGYPESDGVGIHIYIYSKDRKESLF